MYGHMYRSAHDRYLGRTNGSGILLRPLQPACETGQISVNTMKSLRHVGIVKNCACNI